MIFLRQLDFLDDAPLGANVLVARVGKSARALQAGGLVQIEVLPGGVKRISITDNGRKFIGALRRMQPLSGARTGTLQ